MTLHSSSPRGCPPRRRCPGCGGDVYAWAPDSLCRRCLREQTAGAAATARAMREARRQERLDSLDESRPDPPAWNTFPEGY